MKKYVSILLSALLLLTMLPLGVVSVAAEVYGGLTYKIVDDQVTITGYTDDLPSELVIPATIDGYPVTTIGDRAFDSCLSLTSVTIPNGITTIGDYAFHACEALTSVTIPNSVTTIGEWAFFFCYSLPSVTIPNGVTTIKDGAFAFCLNLTAVTIPSSVTNIGTAVFNYCSGLTSIEVEGNNSHFSSQDGVLFSKDKSTLVRYPEGKSGSYIIPDSVTSIDNNAFYYCQSLTEVVIPNSVTTIGDSAFFDCGSIADVYYSGSESDRESMAIGSGNECLTDATWHYAKENQPEVPAGLLYEIADGAVTITGYTDDLPSELDIPATIEGYPVITIGNDAFFLCNNLTSVTIPASVTSIGDCAFTSCLSLTSVIIGDSVTVIGDSAFSGCNDLTAITVADGNAYYCSVDGVLFNKDKTTLIQCPGRGIGAYTIPDSVTTIGNDAFSGCNDLTAITVADGNAYYCSIDGVLFSKDKTTLIRYPRGKVGEYAIPDSVTTIGNGAFDACYRLTSVTIGDSVTTIRDSAFSCCNLTSVIIGDSVTTIGNDAFFLCNNLTSVTIPDSVITIGNDAFFLCDSLSDVFYTGSEADRAAISIGSWNTPLLNATWHYADDPISDTVQHSVMDTEHGNGLAFRFELTAKGVVRDNGNVVGLTNTTVNYLGNDCKLVGMGAVITNDDGKGNILQMLRENVNGETMIDIPAVYLYDVGVGSCTFATRIIDIPDTQLERVIYARPYYIVEVDGEQITVYGEIDSATCAEYM